MNHVLASISHLPWEAHVAAGIGLIMALIALVERLIKFAAWLPLGIKEVNDNWHSTFLNRRTGSDRRSETVVVPFERRSGRDRRQQDRQRAA